MTDQEQYTKIRALSNIELHQNLVELGKVERRCVVGILLHLLECERRKLFFSYGYFSIADYCREHLGYSRDQAFNRTRVARLIGELPAFIPLLRNGETTLSALCAICPRITHGNADKFLEFIPGKSKREVKRFANRVEPDGSLLPEDIANQREVQITVTQEVLDKIERAEALIRRGKEAGLDINVLLTVLDDFLERRDPVEKAKRHATRQEKVAVKNKSQNPAPTESSTDCPSQGTAAAVAPGQLTQSKNERMAISGQRLANTPNRRHIPAALRHQVFIRDKGQCTYLHRNGSKCSRTRHLEIDHIKGWSLGGDHSMDNLRVLCFEHNQRQAVKQMQRNRQSHGQVKTPLSPEILTP